MVGITWLSKQNDRLINYALARFYWLDPQDFERHILEQKRQQDESKQNRLKRGVLKFALVKSRRAGGQNKVPTKMATQINEADAKMIIDQMNPIFLCGSLRLVYDNECKKRYNVESKRYDTAIIVIEKLTSIDPAVSRKLYTNGYTSLIWRLKRPLSDKAYDGLKKNLINSCYYALERSIHIEELISDYLEDIEKIAPGLLTEVKSIAQEQFRLGENSWIKFLNHNIKKAIKGNPKEDEMDDDSNEHNRKTSTVDDGARQHEVLSDLARDIVLKEVIDQLCDDQELVDAVYNSDKNKNYKSNYSVWLKSLVDHCSAFNAYSGGSNAKKHLSESNVFYYTRYSPEMLYQHIFEKHWADETQEEALRFHKLDKERARLTAQFRPEVVLQDGDKLKSKIKLELEKELQSELDPTQEILHRKQLDEKVKVRLEKEIQAKVEKKVASQLNSTPNAHIGRFRRHLTQRLRALLDHELEAYAMGGEKDIKTVVFWKHWCQYIESNGTCSTEIKNLKNLPECSSEGIAAFKYRSWKLHEKLCGFHHTCTYLQNELSDIDGFVHSEEFTALNPIILDKLSYLSLVLTLIDTVTRVRDGSSRRKKTMI